MTEKEQAAEDKARNFFTAERIAHWDAIYRKPTGSLGGYYHRRIEEMSRFLISPGQRVLELGCGKGDLLAALMPSNGVGVDFSQVVIDDARERHPALRFVCADALDVELDEFFDVIILSDLVNEVWDVQKLFEAIARYCHDGTRIVINAFSRVWQPVLNAARSLGLATPLLSQNWLAPDDITNLLRLEGFEVVKSFSDILLPLNIPIVSRTANRFFSKVAPFRLFCLTNFIVARKIPAPPRAPEPTVSIIVAARNEEGNIPEIFRRTPEIGGGTELIFVEGGSRDNTYGAVERAIQANPQRNVKLFRQTGKGKGDAVRLGFSKASGDILMILDADMTVPPEDLPRFYRALVEGKGEFINGVRLIYPMEKKAMRFFNLVGNKFFSLAFSWLLGQPIKDTLCGTKVLTRENYEKIAANRAYFGEFDPFGDFDLIFGAAKQNLKMVDLPIRYRERLYGDTNIQRWRHGMILLRMVSFAAKRIKFV